MNNFIVSYDLNGRYPTHAQMDEHIRKGCYQYGRILETVWFIKRPGTAADLAAYIGRILSPNDRLMVVQGSEAYFQNLLTGDVPVIQAWNTRHVA